MKKKLTPKTDNEERLLNLIKQIHAGITLADFLIPLDQVKSKLQPIILNELSKWKA